MEPVAAITRSLPRLFFVRGRMRLRPRTSRVFWYEGGRVRRVNPLPLRVSALILDLDETLVDDDRGMRAAVDLVARELGERHPSLDAAHLRETYVAESYGFWKTLGSVPTASGHGSDGRTIRVSGWGRVLAICGVQHLITAEEAAALYATARRRTYALFDDVIPFLNVAAKRWSLVILTNGAGDTQREKVSATGLDRYVRTVLVSGDIGSGKPDPEAFRAALHALGTTPAETAHIGDSLTSDVEGAAASGIFPVWLRRSPESMPGGASSVTTISSLTELLPGGPSAG